MDISTELRALAALAAALVIGATGCFRVEFDEGAIACGEAGCPPGYACARDGTCQPENQPSCGSTLALGDTFSGGEPAAHWSDYGAPEQGDGALIVPAQPDTWSGYESKYPYDLRNARIYAEVVEVASGPNYDVHLSALSRPPESAEYEARVVVRDGQLIAEWRRDSVSSEVAAPIPYAPSDHRFWQIRERDGTMYWETSPDGEAWETLASDATPFDVEYVHIAVGAGTSDEGSAPDGQSRFASVNGGAPHVGHCGVSSVRDTFDDRAITRRWASMNEWDGCTTSFSEGMLQFENAEHGGCRLRSRMLFDLSDDALTIEVPDVMGIDNGMYSYVELRDLDSSRLSMIVYDGRLRFDVHDGETGRSVDYVDYDPEAHRWWRMTIQGSTMRWLVSPDGQAWTEAAAAPRTVDPQGVQIRIGADGYEQEGITDQAAFANLNTPP